MTDVSMWPEQKLQDKMNVEIVIEGVSHWSEIYPETTTIEEDWGGFRKGDVVPVTEAFRREAELNRVSLEWTVLSRLVNRGFVLEELECEFWGSLPQSQWGRSTWYKDHPSYHQPPKSTTENFPDGDPRDYSFLIAHFKTEHAGDQEFTLMSTAMIGAIWCGEPRFMFHKTILFRRVVLSAPKSAVAKAA